MKKTIMFALALLAATLFAEHVYPDNPDPTNTAFFGQLNRDSRVVTNTQHIVETDPTVHEWAKEHFPFAPTNTAEAAGKAADAKLTGIALTNRYTKAEADAKLAEKVDKDEAGYTYVPFSGAEYDVDLTGRSLSAGNVSVDEFLSGKELQVFEDAEIGGDATVVGSVTAGGDVKTASGDSLKGKAEKTESMTGGMYNIDIDGFYAEFSEFYGEGGKGNTDVVVVDKTVTPAKHHILSQKADRSMISATEPTFSNAVMGVASHTNADFAAEVLAVQVASLSTNITEEVYIAATNACANLGIDPALIPGAGTTGTVGGLIVMLFAVVFWMKRKIFDNSGNVSDVFATDILGKQVAKEALMIPLEAKTDSFTAEDGHAYAVTMTGTVTITMPTVTEGKAAIFQARFSAAAQQSVEFSTTDLVKFDGTDCGIVKAGKDALLSAMWNGEAWDLVWKNEA